MLFDIKQQANFVQFSESSNYSKYIYLSYLSVHKAKMPQITDQDVKIHMCTFQGHFLKAKLNLRFPCSFFIQWKSFNGKQLVQSQNKYKAKNSIIQFNETLVFSTQLLFFKTAKQYLKKQTILKINLVSASRPDQIKLVGQLTIDLAQIANSQKYEIQGARKLNYCSVDAELMFSIKLIQSKQLNKFLNQLDRSAFNSQIYNIQNSQKVVSERSRSKSREAREIVQKVKSSQNQEQNQKIVSAANYSNTQAQDYIKQNPQKRRDYIMIEESPSHQQQSPEKINKEIQPVIDQINQNQDLLTDSHKNFKTFSEKSHVSQLSQQNKTLKSQLQKHYNKIVQLQSHCKSLIDQLQKERQQSRIRLVNSIEQEKTNALNLKQRLLQCQVSIGSKNDEIKSLQEQVNNFNWLIAKKDEEIGSFEFTVMQRQNRIKQLQANISMQDNKKQIQNQLLIKTEQILTLQQKIQQFQNSKQENNFLSQKIKALQIDLQLQKQSNKAIQMRILENNQLLQKITLLEVDLQQQKQIVEVVQQKNNKLEEDFNQVNALIGTQAGVSEDYYQENLRTTLKEQIQKLINQKSQIKRQNQILKAENQKLNLSQKSKPQSPNITPQCKVETGQEVISNSQKTHQIEENPLSAALSTGHKLQYQNKLKKIQQKYSAEYDRMCAAYEQKIANLKQEFDKFTAELEVFKAQIVTEQKQEELQSIKQENIEQNTKQIESHPQIQIVEQQTQNQQVLLNSQKNIEIVKVVDDQEINQEKSNDKLINDQAIQSQIIVKADSAGQVKHVESSQNGKQEQIIANTKQIGSTKLQQKEVIQQPANEIKEQQNPDVQQIVDQSLHPVQYYKSQVSDLQAKLKVYQKQLQELRANQFYPQMKERPYDDQQERDPQNQHIITHAQSEQEIVKIVESQPNTEQNQLSVNQSRDNQKFRIQVNQVQSMASSFCDPYSLDQIIIKEQDYLPRKITFGRVKKDQIIEQKPEQQKLVQTKRQANSLNNSANNQNQNFQLENLIRQKQHESIHKSQPLQNINQSHHFQNIISELSQSNAQIREQSISLNQQYEQKVAEMILLQEKIKQLNQELNIVKASNAQLQHQSKHLQNSLRQLQKNIQELNEDAKTKDNVIFDMEDKITQSFNLKFELSQLMEIKTELQNIIKGRDEKINELQQNVNQLKRQLQNNISNESQYLKLASREDHEPRIQQKQNKNFDKVQQSGVQVTPVSDINKNDQIKTLQQKVNHIQGMLGIVESRNQQLKKDNNSLKQQNKNLQQLIGIDKQEFISKSEEAIAEKQNCKRIQKELNAVKIKCLEMDSQKKILQEKVSTLLIELEQNNSQPFNTKQSSVIQKVQNNSTPITPVEQLNQYSKQQPKFQQYQSRKPSFHQSIGSNSDTQMNLTTTRNMIQIQKQLEQLKGQLYILREQLISQNKENSKLKSMHSKCGQDNAQLQNRFNQMQSSHIQLQQSHQRLTESHEQLERVYKQMKNQYKQYRDTYQQQINKWIIMKQESKFEKVQLSNISPKEDKKQSPVVSELSQKIKNLQYQNKVLNRKLSQLQSKTSLVSQSQINRQELAPKLIENDQLQLQKENLLKQKEEIIMQKELKIQQQQNELNKSRELLKEKINLIIEKQMLLQEKNNIISQKTVAFDQKVKELSQKNKTIKQNQSKLEQLLGLVNQRDYLITQKDNVLQQYANIINQKQIAITQLKNSLQQKLQKLKQQNSVIGLQNQKTKTAKQIQQKNQQLRVAYQTIDQMQLKIQQQEFKNRQLQSKITQAGQKVANNNQQRQANIRQIQQLTVAYQQKESQLYTQQANIIQLQSKLSDNAKTITEQLLELQRIKPKINEFDSIQAILQEQVNALSASLEQAKIKQTQMSDQLVNKQKIIEQLLTNLEKNGQSQNQKMNNNVVEMTNEIQTLREEVETYQTRIQQLLQQKSQLSEQANSIDTLLKQSEQEIKVLKDTIIGIQDQNRQLMSYKAENQSKRTQEQVQKTNLDNAVQRIFQLEASLNETKLLKEKQNLDVVRMEKQLQILQQSLEQIKSQNNRKQFSNKQLKQSVRNLQQKINEKDGSIIQLTFSMQETANKNKELLSYISKYQKKEQMMKEHLNMLEEQSNRIFTMVKEKQIQQQKYIQTIENLEGEVQAYKIMNLELNESLTDKINRITFLSQKQKTNQISKGDEEQSEKIKQLIANNQKLLQKNKEYLQLLSRKTSVVIDNQKLKHVIQKLQAKNTKLQDDVTKNKKRHEQKLSEIINKCKQVENQNKKLKQKVTVNTIVNQLNQINANQSQTVIVKPLQSIIKQKAEKIQELSSKLKEAESEGERLKVQQSVSQQKHSQHLNIITSNQKSILQLKSKLSEFNTQSNDPLMSKKSSVRKNQSNMSNLNAGSEKDKNNNQNLQRISQLEGQNVALKSQIQKQNSKINQIQTQIQQIKTKRITDPQLRLQRKKIKQELQQAKKREQEYMITVLDLQTQLEDLRKSHSKHNANSNHQSQNHSLSYSYTQANNDHIHQQEKDQLKLDSSNSNKQIICLLDKLKDIQQKRSSGIQAEKILKLLINKNSSLQAQLQNFNQANQQYGKIQQKARQVSCELQKIKSTIIKSKSRDVQEKSQLIATIRPCQTVINQLIRISEQLIQNSVLLSGVNLK